MIRLEDTTDLRKAFLPDEENELSRRCLRMMEKWVHVGVEYFEEWPDRPNCGHFFGGCHWYGNETAGPMETFALLSISQEYDEKAGGTSREELRQMAIQALRFLCFTHDSGPEDCVRPSTGLGRPEICGTKWGERGSAYFRASQCGHGISAMGRVALLLRDEIDEETWMMVARVHEDYAGRFGNMDPRSGVYVDTQMEENAWTSNGLTSCCLFLSGHGDLSRWEATNRRWLYSTCASPQDAKDGGQVGNSTSRKMAGKIFTALPDYWAENHGMVHPNYTGSGIRSMMIAGAQFKLWGKELPPEIFWNRKRVYENLKAMTDGAGYAQAVQGMDWHYLPTSGSEAPHAIASVMLDDAEAATLERRGLRNTDVRQEANGGRMYEKECALAAHDQQDPMIMREVTISSVGHLYLFHRLFGPGADPIPEKDLETRLAGVRVYPHAGFVHHRHAKGQTSFAWRNSIMAMPLTRDGIYTISPCSDSWLGRPEVDGKPDSHRLVDVQVTNYDDSFAAAMVMDRCQESLRQQVVFAGLPDGRGLSFDKFGALEDVKLVSLDQGFLRVTNEHFPLLGDNCRGERKIHHPDGEITYKGWHGETESEDVVDQLGSPDWVNIDGKIGIRFLGTGTVVYHNRHYFRPYRAIADDLTLSHQEESTELKSGDEAGRLIALVGPEEGRETTSSARLEVLDGSDNTACLVTDGYLVAANFEPKGRMCTFSCPRDDEVWIYAGTTLTTYEDRVEYAISMGGMSACRLQAVRRTCLKGRVRVDAVADGTTYVTDLDGESPRASILA